MQQRIDAQERIARDIKEFLDNYPHAGSKVAKMRKGMEKDENLKFLESVLLQMEFYKNPIK